MNFSSILNFSQNTRDTFKDVDNVKSFNKLMFDTANRSLKDITEEQANKKLRSMIFSALGISEDAKKREIKRAMRHNYRLVFQIIEDIIESQVVTGWPNDPFFKKFVEIKNGDEGDANRFYVKKNVFLQVEEIANGHHSLRRQKLGAGESFSVKVNTYGIKVYTEFLLFLTGQADLTELINAAAKARDLHLNNMLYEALLSARDKLPGNEAFKKTGALTEDKVIELCSNVHRATGVKPTIFGTEAALMKLHKILPIDWVSDTMRDEVRNTGRLGVWNGYQVAEIPQAFQPFDIFDKNAGAPVEMVANNRLMIFGADEKFIKLYYEGDPIISEARDKEDHEDMTLDYEYIYKMGVSVIITQVFGDYEFDN
jgi:hypothetical protein